GQEDLRGFEWDYWYRRAHAYRRSRPGGGGAVALSPDGGLLAAGGDRLHVRDLATGRVLFERDTPWIYALVFTPDGQTLVAGHGAAPATGQPAGSLSLWDIATGDCIVLPGHTDIPGLGGSIWSVGV